ncbi:MAG: hypothetical protein D3909_11940 [Candidatus Electrothrix sp. ATG1]|nr:hypothetical protein [Candidatus Electrothrix sp. ATG1]MCI5207924.1 hypothetical protein [Candidatus Electrothrix sp. ATG2]
MKPFSKWTVPEVEEEFQLTLDPDFQGLRSWLQGAADKVHPDEIAQLQGLSKKLALRVRDWNEEELKISFIALLLDMIDFYDTAYRPFMEREVSVEYADNKKLWGIVDFLVAQGRHAPKEQFFFLHEYKKQLDTSNDPLGQLLAEMVAAQTINQHSHPIYGAYVIGRHWYFVLLDGKIYSESLAYDATKDEIIEIFGMLRHTKEIIQRLVSSTDIKKGLI